MNDIPVTSSPPTSTIKIPTRAVVIAVAIVAVVLFASVVEIEIGSSGFTHVRCDGQARLGNVSAWYPYSFIAAPYNGSESGELRVWENYTVGGVYRNLTSAIPTSVVSGDVKLGWATGGNWTVFSSGNSTVQGNGLSDPCTASMIAFLGPPNGPVSEAWGGGIVATGIRTDAGLPSSFNASDRCALINESADCAVSAHFDLNYTRAMGEVNTCGKLDVASLNVTGEQLVATIPFAWNGRHYDVPIGPSPQGGMFAWFNYTFPANGGVWQYESLPGLFGTSSGLVFSYSPCP